MDIVAEINTAGLMLAMAGVVLIFVWGPPQPVFQEYVAISVEENTVLNDGTKVADLVAAERRLKRRHERLSRLGLGLVFIGFLFQLVATWVPSLIPDKTAVNLPIRASSNYL